MSAIIDKQTLSNYENIKVMESFVKVLADSLILENVKLETFQMPEEASYLVNAAIKFRRRDIVTKTPMGVINDMYSHLKNSPLFQDMLKEELELAKEVIRNEVTEELRAEIREEVREEIVSTIKGIGNGI